MASTQRVPEELVDAAFRAAQAFATARTNAQRADAFAWSNRVRAKIAAIIGESEMDAWYDRQWHRWAPVLYPARV